MHSGDFAFAKSLTEDDFDGVELLRDGPEKSKFRKGIKIKEVDDVKVTSQNVVSILKSPNIIRDLVLSDADLKFISGMQADRENDLPFDVDLSEQGKTRLTLQEEIPPLYDDKEWTPQEKKVRANEDNRADSANLLKGDVITEVDGKPVDASNPFDALKKDIVKFSFLWNSEFLEKGVQKVSWKIEKGAHRRVTVERSILILL